MSGANECYSLGYYFDDPNLGTQAMDSVYSLNFSFAHSGCAITLNFAANGLQPLLTDESWGLDNVQLDMTPVPLSGALGSMLAGLGAIVGFARRALATDSPRVNCSAAPEFAFVRGARIT